MVLERSFTRKQLLKFQQEYSIKLTNTEDCDLGEGKGKVSETRGLMVIKTSNKTKASQRKGAISAWKVSNVHCLVINHSQDFQIKLKRNTLCFNVIQGNDIQTWIQYFIWLP